MKTEGEPKHRGVYEKTPGSGVWWIRWHDAQGRRHREKIGSKSVAIKVAEKRRVAVRENQKLPELRPRIVPFGEIAADALAYSEKHKRDYRTDRSRMRRLLGWWKDRPADSLTPEEIEDRLNSVAQWTDSTRNRMRALLLLTHKLANRHGKVKENPARLFPARPERAVRQGFIDDAQYTRLIQIRPPLWLRAMLALGYTYGWRAGELIGLRVRQLDLAAGTVRLEPGTTKNGEGRTIRLTSGCFELLRACMLEKQQGDFVFTRPDGRAVHAYRYDWEHLCARAGLGRFVCENCQAQGPVTSATGRACRSCTEARQLGVYRYEGILFHDLRRSAVRNLERAGVPRSFAMKVTGHKTEAVYRRYAICSEQDMAEAIGRLERFKLKSENEGAPASTAGIGIPAKMM